MAWTTPRTWVTSEVVSASLMNTHVRDQFNETGPAQVSTAGRILVSDAANSLAGRLLVSDAVTTSETTASTSYTDLATSGPSVTATTSTAAVIWFAARLSNDSTNGTFVSVDVSGATTTGPSDNRALEFRPATAGYSHSAGYGYISGLTAGSNTFKLEYKVSAGTGTFSNRRIAVMPL